MDADEARTIGRRLRQVRHARRMSLEAVAGLCAISPGHLSRIERGERALDRHSLIAALADALRISPTELTSLQVPALCDGESDRSTELVRHALMAVGNHQPGGEVCPLDALQARVVAIIDAHTRCDRPGDVGVVLPTLIRDLHSSIAAGRDVVELLELAVLLHTQVTVGWLRVVGAPLDLRWQAVALARHAAEGRETSTAVGIAVWGGLYVMIGAGTFDLALSALDGVDVPTNSAESMQLAGTLALSRSLLAAVDGRPGDVDAPFQEAVELAERTGEGNAYGLSFGPTNLGLWKMYGQLDMKDYEQAVRIGAGLQPEAHLPRLVQADYWVNYGRALARLRSRREDAVTALRRAEHISPSRLYRDPFATDVLAELVSRARDDALGRELRGMAYRAGLPV